VGPAIEVAQRPPVHNEHNLMKQVENSPDKVVLTSIFEVPGSSYNS
jgi:hypothetical protein